MQAVTMPFGKHKGQALNEVPLGYLQWLIRSDVRLGRGFRRDIERELATRQDRTVGLSLPVCPDNRPGEIIDALRDATEEALYTEAVMAGELVITPDMPCSSRVPGWYLEWCQTWGQPYRVREITWEQIADAIREGKELPS